MSDHEELFAAIDEIERHGRKRGRRDEYSFSVSDEEDFPPVDVLPDDHQEGEQEEILPQEHGPRRNIVRPFGEPGDLDDEEEPDPEEGDEADRDADREERRRVPASRVESDRRVFDSEQEEIGLRRTRTLNRHFFPEAGEEGERDFDVDTYPDEHAAGMILPHVILDNENIYFRSLFTVINEMGKETTRLLRIRFNGKGVDREGKEATSLTEEDLSNCRAWLKYWTAYVVEHHYTVLGRVLRLPIGPDGADESITCTACLMWEIWRITVILRYDDLDKHRKWKIKDSEFLCDRLVNTPGVPLDPAPIAPIAPTEKELEKGNKERLLQKYNEAMGVYNEALGKWKKKKLVIDTPVLLLKQSQIRHLLQFISSRMRIVPYHEDMKLLLDILELKSAIFFCRHMPSGLLDEPKFRSDIRNDEARLAGLDPESQAAEERFGSAGVRFRITRDYLIFCASYWYPIVRARYYAEHFALMNLPADVDRVLPPGCVDRLKVWVERMTKAQGERYPDRIEHVGKDSLLNPGDKEWHEYMCINDSTNTDAILRAIRGEHAYQDYHSQLDVSYQVMLSQAGKNHLADMFVFYVFDRYMSTYKQGFKWMAGYVVINEFIDEPETFDKWTTTKEPLLICVWNSFWLMYERCVWPIDNAYTAICAWLHAVRRTRELARMPADCLADGTYVGDLIDAILYGKEAQEYVEDDDNHREYTERLKRGIPGDTTRVKL